MPVTLGTVVSMPSSSEAEYDGSMPRYGRISDMTLLDVGATMLPPET